MEYKFWDEDVESVKNCAYIGNEEAHEIIFKKPIEALNIHKDDVIHLAKCLGLVVFERESEL